MASIGFLIGGALVNALAFQAVIICSVVYRKNQSKKNEKDMIRLLKTCNRLNYFGQKKDKNDSIT